MSHGGAGCSAHVGRNVLLILMMSPVFLIEVIFPPRLDIALEQHYVTFQFADVAYALKFAKQNRELMRYEGIFLGRRRAAKHWHSQWHTTIIPMRLQ